MIAAYIRFFTINQKADLQKLGIENWAKGNGIDPNKIKWFEDCISSMDSKGLSSMGLQKNVFDGK